MTSTISELAALIRNGTLSDREKWRVARRFAEVNSIWALGLLMHGSSERTARLRREYWLRAIVLIFLIVLMFAFIFVMMALTNGAEAEEFTASERALFIGFIALEVIDVVNMFLLAFSCHRRIVRNVLMEAEAATIAPSWNMPEWEEVVSLCRDAGLAFSHPVADVIYHEDGDRRAVILDRGNGSFEVVFERLYFYEQEELYGAQDELPGFWSSAGSGKTIVDSVDRGREIAKEEMEK